MRAGLALEESAPCLPLRTAVPL